MQVEGLNIHPLKSGRAIPLETATVRIDGLAGDRRYMIVEPDGRFITQRELQALARVEATAVGESLHLEMDGRQLFASFEPEDRLDVPSDLFQLFFELFICQIKGTDSVRLHILHIDLILPACLVHGKISADQVIHPVFRPELQ